MMRIVANKNRNNKKKFPWRIILDNKRSLPVPSQYNFKSDFIRRHGCSLVAFYMALRFSGCKKSVKNCKSYLDKNIGLKGRSKYNLQKITTAINKILSGSPVTFKKSPSKEAIKKVLKRGDMVLFEERDPIHTVVLLQYGKNIIRFSDGKYKRVTVDQEVAKRCRDNYYGGCIFVKGK